MTAAMGKLFAGCAGVAYAAGIRVSCRARDHFRRGCRARTSAGKPFITGVGMRLALAVLVSCFVAGAMAWRSNAVPIYAQTGFNDQSGINSNATVGSPYTLNQTINGRGNGEPGWTGPWTT